MKLNSILFIKYLDYIEKVIAYYYIIVSLLNI